MLYRGTDKSASERLAELVIERGIVLHETPAGYLIKIGPAIFLDDEPEDDAPAGEIGGIGA